VIFGTQLRRHGPAPASESTGPRERGLGVEQPQTELGVELEPHSGQQGSSTAPAPSLFGWLRIEWDRAGAWALIATGLVLLILGYIGASGTVFPAEQIPYVISGGIGGLFALGIGCMLWLSADLRDEWRKIDRLERAVRATALTGQPPRHDTVDDVSTRVSSIRGGNGA
jgi:hypothetical protein